MNFKIITTTVRSITVERINTDQYESSACQVLVNDHLYTETDKNVISVFGLDPDTEYKLTLKDETGEEWLLRADHSLIALPGQGGRRKAQEPVQKRLDTEVCHRRSEKQRCF